MRIEIGHQTRPKRSGARNPSLHRTPNTRLLSIRDDHGVFRARLIGSNLRTLDTDKLRAELVGLHTQGHPPAIMLTMRGIDSLSSSVLGTIAMLNADLEAVGGVLVLYNLPKEIAKILRKTKLDRMIPTAKSRPHARKRALAIQKRHAETAKMHAA